MNKDLLFRGDAVPSFCRVAIVNFKDLEMMFKLISYMNQFPVINYNISNVEAGIRVCVKING